MGTPGVKSYRQCCLPRTLEGLICWYRQSQYLFRSLFLLDVTVSCPI